MKRKYIYMLLVPVALYIFMGLIFFGKGKGAFIPGSNLENNDGQETALQMKEAEDQAEEAVLAIEKQKEEGTLDTDGLSRQIEASRKYLAENLDAVDLENGSYMELLYHSSFLKLLAEKYKLSGSGLEKLANEVHTYIVEASSGTFGGEKEKELRAELEKMAEGQSLEAAEQIKKYRG